MGRGPPQLAHWVRLRSRNRPEKCRAGQHVKVSDPRRRRRSHRLPPVGLPDAVGRDPPPREQVGADSDGATNVTSGRAAAIAVMVS